MSALFDQQPSETPQPQPMADELTLLLKCPKCGAGGRVQWKSLRHGMKCRKCNCQFLIASDGKLISQDDLPQVRFNCPRCGTSGQMPTMVAGRGGKCPACKMPLATDQNQNLRGAEEAAMSRRMASMAARKKQSADRQAARASSNGEVRLPRQLIWGGGAVVAVLMAWLIYSAGQGGRPDSLGQNFTRTCLTGDWEAALAFIEDDAVQQAEFKRWRSRYFPSILDAHRPKGDSVNIAVDLLAETAETRVFRMTLRSPFIGERKHAQHWALRDGKWLFDVVATLADHGQPAAGVEPSATTENSEAAVSP